ncbi:MAG: DsbA family protein [Gammaproteobacteria bacterium]|nr:DsbA family protein [Gammaproteobacteria bacterium]
MNSNRKATLYYIHDPMCSWCWGFKAVLNQLHQQLPEHISLKYVLGGLAADSDVDMPADMQKFLQKTWHTIENKIPGTHFNFNFWTNCKPRRSTYPACRAVIATKQQDITLERDMIHAIQKAYYCDAKNPSDSNTLIEIAESLKLDTKLFETDLNSPETKNILADEIRRANNLGAQGFPSLVFENHQRTLLHLDYTNVENILKQIKALD